MLHRRRLWQEPCRELGSWHAWNPPNLWFPPAARHRNVVDLVNCMKASVTRILEFEDSHDTSSNSNDSLSSSSNHEPRSPLYDRPDGLYPDERIWHRFRKDWLSDQRFVNHLRGVTNDSPAGGEDQQSTFVNLLFMVLERILEDDWEPIDFVRAPENLRTLREARDGWEGLRAAWNPQYADEVIWDRIYQILEQVIFVVVTLVQQMGREAPGADAGNP